MVKESNLGWFSKLLLGEVSSKIIAIILSLSTLSTLFSLFVANILMIKTDIFLKPITQWRISTIIFLTLLFITYNLFLFFITIKLHKRATNHRKFYLFDFSNYQWKLLLPERKLESSIPNCPKHGVRISVSGKCPFCDIILVDNFRSLAIDAQGFGIAKLDGHFKG